MYVCYQSVAVVYNGYRRLCNVYYFLVKRGVYNDAISTSWEFTNDDRGRVRVTEGISTNEPSGPLYESYKQWHNPVFKLPVQVCWL